MDFLTSVPLDLSRVEESFELGGTRLKKCFQTQRDPAIPDIDLVDSGCLKCFDASQNFNLLVLAWSALLSVEK